MRQDVFDSIVAFEKKGVKELSAEKTRYVERQIKLGKRNGECVLIIRVDSANGGNTNVSPGSRLSAAVFCSKNNKI